MENSKAFPNVSHVLLRNQASLALKLQLQPREALVDTSAKDPKSLLLINSNARPRYMQLVVCEATVPLFPCLSLCLHDLSQNEIAL